MLLIPVTNFELRPVRFPQKFHLHCFGSRRGLGLFSDSVFKRFNY
jgi:hypothetical protein